MIANTISRALLDRIQQHAREWRLEVEDVIETESSAISFVSRGGHPLVLKVVRQPGDEWHSLLITTAALLTELKSDLVVLFGPVLTVFLYGLARLLYALLKEQSTGLERTTQLPVSSATSRPLNPKSDPALPAHESMPISNWGQPVETAEMVQPPSVTDNTTKLL